MIESNGCGSDGVCNFSLDSCNHDASAVSSEMSLQNVSNEFVDNEIRNMNTGKATSLDDVGIRILRIARPVTVESLTLVFLRGWLPPPDGFSPIAPKCKTK